MAGRYQASIGVVVVTHEARQHLTRCLPPLFRSRLRPRVLVVNSSSGDGTVELARTLGAETLVVPRHTFNHGLMRELARRRLGTGIVVMLTPDAYPSHDDFLERLTAPLRHGLAAVAYGRQVARQGADLVERAGRAFNYPAESQLRSLADWDRHGSYTHFCSNACAAWSSTALDAIGGFKPTLVSEETIAVAELLARGERIAYVADAVVEHSHAHSLRDAFRRQFDIGYARRVRFTGFLDAAGVRRELHEAGCFVNPADYETGPLTLLEAMACGTPVVTTATGLAAEMGPPTPLLVSDPAPEALAGAIRVTLAEPMATAARAREARALVVARYGWERVVDRLEAVYGVRQEQAA
jgi:rhamnosyltransferase